ncbi:MAG: CHC2 zinc finger domain-containing protein [Anaerolineae bacterium]
MASMTPIRFDVDALRRAYPLADLLEANGITLTPAGRQRLKGLCPFHDDRRPSLIVYQDDQHFHCFACGAHGDVVDFVRRRFHLSFLDACRWLADLPPQPRPLPSDGAMRRGSRRWDRLTLEEQVVMNTTAAVYHRRLWREQRVRDYLHSRGIPDRVIHACALGYADGYSLEAFLRRRSGLKTAQELGLLRRAEPHDDHACPGEFLAGRIVVPEIRGGQCIWLIGRRLDDDQERPKYLALPGERPVLGQLRAAGQREAFLVEGVFDYLTAVAWDLPAFSPCGTHLPADRLGFLARARVVFGVFDGDAAGAQATARFAECLDERWQPIALPEGCDLNDLASQPGGSDEFFRRLKAAKAARQEEVARAS